MVATLASKDGEFLRKISHQLIWWLHRKLSILPAASAAAGVTEPAIASLIFNPAPCTIWRRRVLEIPAFMEDTSTTRVIHVHDTSFRADKSPPSCISDDSNTSAVLSVATVVAWED
ncbi:hypothetical protein B0H13DRAFT_2303272 [Mycena leptocephala]|nr:hypothetical protein B0H13DRAFT_2303272 [Mycena leptocephala]